MDTGDSFHGAEWPRREADYTFPRGVEVKNLWSYITTAQYIFMARCLVKHRNKFTSLLSLRTEVADFTVVL
jgi:hypothetical protein